MDIEINVDAVAHIGSQRFTTEMEVTLRMDAPLLLANARILIEKAFDWADRSKAEALLKELAGEYLDREDLMELVEEKDASS